MYVVMTSHVLVTREFVMAELALLHHPYRHEGGQRKAESKHETSC